MHLKKIQIIKAESVEKIDEALNEAESVRKDIKQGRA